MTEQNSHKRPNKIATNNRKLSKLFGNQKEKSYICGLIIMLWLSIKSGLQTKY